VEVVGFPLPFIRYTVLLHLICSMYSPTPERLFARYFTAWLQLPGQPLPPPGFFSIFKGL